MTGAKGQRQASQGLVNKYFQKNGATGATSNPCRHMLQVSYYYLSTVVVEMICFFIHHSIPQIRNYSSYREVFPV